MSEDPREERHNGNYLSTSHFRTCQPGHRSKLNPLSLYAPRIIESDETKRSLTST